MEYGEALKANARKLRNNSTETEIRLWARIRRKQIKNLHFYRQKTIGKYIADFYCPARKLVIEIDGGQHYEWGELIEGDKERENYLKNILKLKVLRFTNLDIKNNIVEVVDKIYQNC